METTKLAEIIKSIGITFEKANPAVFRTLAAVLPYSTPTPVAWLTMRNAAKFLSFDPWVAFVFVFGLEGMGLWFTSMFVDAVVAWVRSRNWKSFFVVVLLGSVVAAYVYLLVNLNVILDAGNESEVYSRVVTLLCFLPLLTGIGNGYYKLQLDNRDKQEEQTAYERERYEKDEERRKDERIQKAAIKHGINPLVSFQQIVPTPVVEQVERFASDFHEEIVSYMNKNLQKYGKEPRVVEIWRNVLEKEGISYNSSKSYISTQRTKWMRENGLEN